MFAAKHTGSKAFIRLAAFLLSLLLAASALAAFVGCSSPEKRGDIDRTVEFGDPAFEAAVREACGFEGDITLRDVLGVTELDLSGKGLKDISDIALFENLEVLDLGEGPKHLPVSMKDIDDPAAEAINEKLLSFGLDQSHVDWLADKLNLISYPRGLNEIEDISALSGLKKLRALDIAGFCITDLSVLKELPKLEELNITGQSGADLSVIADLRGLRKLEAVYTGISVGNVSDLTELTYLDLSGNGIEDLSGIEKLKKLEHLSLSRNLITDVSPLAALPELKYLNLSENKIDSALPLLVLNNVELVTLADNPIQSELPVETLSAIRYVYIKKGQIKSALFDELRAQKPECAFLFDLYEICDALS